MNEDEVKALQTALALKQKELDLVMAIDHIRDTTPEPMAMLTSIVNLLADELGAELCLLSLIDPETGIIELKAINQRSDKFANLKRLLTRELAERIVQLKGVTIWQGRDVLPAEATATLSETLQLAAVPIIIGEQKRLGALLLARSCPAFSLDDIQLLETAEDHIDSAVIQGYTHYELQQRVKEIETIYRIDRIRDQGLPFDKMLSVVLHELCATIDAEMGFIMLYASSGQQLEMRAATHDDLFQIASYYEMVNQIANESLRQGELLWRNDLSQHLQAVMCLPLILNDQIIGVLGVANRHSSRNFRRDDRRLLGAIGSQMDTAIFESLERRQLRQVLGRSVDSRILERLLASPDVGFLKGERTTLTVLYGDIRGSTNLAEQTDPELLVGFINHYLSYMTEIVLAFGGTLDKFVGDEVMALFGAPFPQADHALRAIRVGLAMQEAQQTIIDIWQDRGVDAPPIGVGIATGELIVGEMGSPQRSQYTAMGRAANLGARLCSSAQGGQVLLSQATYDLVHDQVEAAPIRGMQFKGVAGPVTVYDVKRVLV